MLTNFLNTFKKKLHEIIDMDEDLNLLTKIRDISMCRVMFSKVNLKE